MVRKLLRTEIVQHRGLVAGGPDDVDRRPRGRRTIGETDRSARLECVGGKPTSPSRAACRRGQPIRYAGGRHSAMVRISAKSSWLTGRGFVAVEWSATAASAAAERTPAGTPIAASPLGIPRRLFNSSTNVARSWSSRRPLARRKRWYFAGAAGSLYRSTDGRSTALRVPWWSLSSLKPPRAGDSE